MVSLAIGRWPDYITTQRVSIYIQTPPRGSTVVKTISTHENRPTILKIHDNDSDVDHPKSWRSVRTISNMEDEDLVVIKNLPVQKCNKPAFSVTRADDRRGIFSFHPYIDKREGCFKAEVAVHGDKFHMEARDDGQRSHINVCLLPLATGELGKVATMHRRRSRHQFRYQVDIHPRMDLLLVATLCTLMDLSIMEFMATNPWRRWLKWGTPSMPRKFKKRNGYHGEEADLEEIWGKG